MKFIPRRNFRLDRETGGPIIPRGKEYLRIYQSSGGYEQMWKVCCILPPFTFQPGCSISRTEYVDNMKRSMHPLLSHTLENPPLAFDLRCSIMEGHNILFQTLGRKYNEVDLAQLAVHPAAPVLRLFHSRLPWYIDIHPSHPNGVTVFDVLVQLSRQMQAPIHSRHYYNETLDSTDRAALAKYFKDRIRGRRGEREKGILQVDFLGEKSVLEGLVRSKQGMWELKTRRPER